jgi:cystathionine beta-synthase
MRPNHTHPDMLSLIGCTALVEVHKLDIGPCQLFLKMESNNPAGSIKDRIALNMINAAEQQGRLKPGGTIIEATAGNTGLGLALIAAYKGYKTLIVIPDKMSHEKVDHLKALGAEIRMTRSDVNKGHPEYYQDLAETLSKSIPNSFYINQFKNPANPTTHETTTAPEIWEQMERRLDAIVVGVGTGGTLMGLGRFFKKSAPNVELILADPEGSVLVPYLKTGKMITPGSWFVEGIGEDFIPDFCDLSMVKDGYTVTDAQAFACARELLAKEGILAGSSSGVLLHAALEYCRQQTEPKRVVTFVCDTGNKYLSKMYNDQWMKEHGFLA